MTEVEREEKYHWIVVFRKGGKVYPYMYRTVEHMTGTVKAHYDKYGVYPHAMWVMVEDEMQKVEIT